MLDLREGDSWIVDSVTYRVRMVLPFDDWGTEPTFAMDATKIATVKRTPAGGSETTVYSALKCTPPDPASQDVQQLVATKAPYKLKETYAADASSFARVVVEELQRV